MNSSIPSAILELSRRRHEKLIAIKNLDDRLAVEVLGIDGDSQQPADGGEGVFGVDFQFGVGGEIDALADAGADGDPGEVAAARVIGAVRAAGAAVIGGQENESR